MLSSRSQQPGQPQPCTYEAGLQDRHRQAVKLTQKQNVRQTRTHPQRVHRQTESQVRHRQDQSIRYRLMDLTERQALETDKPYSQTAEQQTRKGQRGLCVATGHNQKELSHPAPIQCSLPVCIDTAGHSVTASQSQPTFRSQPPTINQSST